MQAFLISAVFAAGAVVAGAGAATMADRVQTVANEQGPRAVSAVDPAAFVALASMAGLFTVTAAGTAVDAAARFSNPEA